MCEAGDRGDDTETDGELDRGQRTHYPTFPLPLEEDVESKTVTSARLHTEVKRRCRSTATQQSLELLFIKDMTRLLNC
jgi:hypothetical protein